MGPPNKESEILYVIQCCLFNLAVIYPLLSKNSGYGDYGWSGSQYGTYRSLNLASLSEKVLNGIEKLYDVYNKNQ